MSLYSQLGKLRETLLHRETEVLAAREGEKVALDKLSTVVSREKSLEAKVKTLTSDSKKALESFAKEKAYLKGQVERASADLKVERDRATEAVEASEALKSEVSELKSKVEELQEEKEQIEAFARLTARAALMRRHLNGGDPMARAEVEVAFYLKNFGPENLDEEDALDAEDKSSPVVEVVRKEVTDEAQVITPPVVTSPPDAPSVDPAQIVVEASGTTAAEAVVVETTQTGTPPS